VSKTMDRGEASETPFRQSAAESSQAERQELSDDLEGRAEYDAERILNGNRLLIENLEQAIENNEGIERLWHSALSASLSYCAAMDRFFEFQNSSEKFHLDIKNFQAELGPREQSRRDAHNGAVSMFQALARNLETVSPGISERLRTLMEDRDTSSVLFLDIAMQEKMRRASQQTDKIQ